MRESSRLQRVTKRSAIGSQQHAAPPRTRSRGRARRCASTSSSSAIPPRRSSTSRSSRADIHLPRTREFFRGTLHGGGSVRSTPRTPEETAVTDPSGGGASVGHGAELQPGTVVGDYQIERRLGHGGMGTVYAAIHPLIEKRVAIKVLRPELSENDEAVARFVQEARAVNRISHPSIVDVFGYG